MQLDYNLPENTRIAGPTLVLFTRESRFSVITHESVWRHCGKHYAANPSRLADFSDHCGNMSLEHRSDLQVLPNGIPSAVRYQDEDSVLDFVLMPEILSQG